MYMYHMFTRIIFPNIFGKPNPMQLLVVHIFGKIMAYPGAGCTETAKFAFKLTLK